MQPRRREVTLTEGPILKNVLLFAVPVILSSILQLLFNAADMVVVGKFAGEAHLAAVGSSGAAINLIVNLCIGLSIGANVTVARRVGEKNEKGVRRAVHTAMLLSIIGGLLAGLLLFVCVKPLLFILQTPAEVFGGAAAYLRAYAVGVPASIIYNFGTAILRAKGDTARPLYFLTVAGVVNVLLNLFFVIVCKRGAVGVGIATAASQYVAAAFVVLCMAREEGAMRLRARDLRIHKQELISILSVGLPSGVQSSLFSLSNLLIQSSVNSFNSTAIVAGSAAAANVEGFVWASMNAFYQTMLTLAGQNMGARNLKRIDKGLGVCCGCVTITGMVLGGLVLLFRQTLLSFYSSEAEVIAYGSLRFMFVVLPYFICGLMDTLMGAVRGLGHSVLPMCVSLLGACAFRIVWIFTVFAHFRTLPSLFLSYPISWILTGSAHLISYILMRKKEEKKFLAI